MRAVRAGHGTVEVREVPAPVGPGVRVDVEAAGICGTDLDPITRVADGSARRSKMSR